MCIRDRHEADVLKKLLDETREQVKMMALQIDDYQAALQQVEDGKQNSMTEYQRAVYRMFQAFVGDEK
mgnify:CR=1 FL=1